MKPANQDHLLRTRAFKLALAQLCRDHQLVIQSDTVGRLSVQDYQVDQVRQLLAANHDDDWACQICPPAPDHDESIVAIHMGGISDGEPE